MNCNKSITLFECPYGHIESRTERLWLVGDDKNGESRYEYACIICLAKVKKVRYKPEKEGEL